MRLVLAIILMFSFSISAAPSLKFTGYKFTEKAGVSGTFKKIDWKLPKVFTSTKELLSNISLSIDTWSIDAGNAARNTNITNALFKNWGDRYIQAKVKNLDTKNSTLIMSMTVGEVTKDVSFKYKNEKGKITFNSTIDLVELGFGSAFSKLSSTCKSLHTGKDGVAKTWSTVDLEVILDSKL